MEQLANPGSIVVSAYTHRLTDGYFAFKDLGPTQIKGVEEPLNIYEVLGAGPLRTRLQVSATRRGLTRFVGRQSEMEQLNKALEQAKAGHGQIVGTMGEPGLGKSRLFYEFKLLSVSGCPVRLRGDRRGDRSSCARSSARSTRPRSRDRKAGEAAAQRAERERSSVGAA